MTPAAHAEHAHRFLFFLRRGIGANEAATKEGATWSRLLTKTCGGIPHKIYYYGDSLLGG